MGNRSAKKTKRVICPPGCIPDSVPVPPKPQPIICPPGCIPAQVQQVIQNQVLQPSPPPQQILIQTPIPQPYPISQQIYTQTIDSQITQLTPPPPQNVQIIQSPQMQLSRQNTMVDQIIQQQIPQPMQTQYIVLRPSSNNNPCPPGCVPIVTLSNTSRGRSSKNSKIRSTGSSSDSN